MKTFTLCIFAILLAIFVRGWFDPAFVWLLHPENSVPLVLYAVLAVLTITLITLWINEQSNKGE